jgi:hypothetical protein
MVRRHSLHAIAAAGLLIPLAGGLSRDLRRARPQPAAAVSEQPGGIRLVNRESVALTVEIRPALTATCTDGPRAASQELRPGAAWVVHSSQALCVRREKLEPGGQRRMEAWERMELAKGRVEEVEL